jgi:hypothetical protein
LAINLVKGRLMTSIHYFASFAVLISFFAGAQPVWSQTAADLWTGNPRIRAAEFRALFLYANSFPRLQAEATRDALQDLVRKFQDDIDDFVEAENDKKMFRNVAVTRYRSEIVRNLTDVKDNITTLSRELTRVPRAPGHEPVVLIYLLAHGVDVGGGRIEIELDAGARAGRDDIRRAARNMSGPKLVVFITDNCSNRIAGAGLPAGTAGGGVWRALYFGHTGFVDIRTSAPNEYAFVSGTGSVFLHGFNNALSPSSLPATALGIASANVSDRQAARKAFVDHFDTIDSRTRERDGVMSWAEFRGHLETQVQGSVTATRNLLPMGDPVRTLMNAGQNVVIDTREVYVQAPQ